MADFVIPPIRLKYQPTSGEDAHSSRKRAEQYFGHRVRRVGWYL